MATGSAVSRLAALGIVLPVPAGMRRPQVTMRPCFAVSSIPQLLLQITCRMLSQVLTCIVYRSRVFPALFRWVHFWLQFFKFVNNLTYHSLLPQIFAHGTYSSGNLLFISGQLCSVDGKVPDHHKGKVGTSEGCVTQEEAWVTAFGWTIFEIISLFSSTVTRPQRHAASIFSLRWFSLCF